MPSMPKRRQNDGDGDDNGDEALEEQTLAYLAMFEHHTSDFQRHLLGLSSWKSVLPASTFDPGALWTAEEKDTFFHGLAIYSRLRPDLVAEHINTSLPSSSSSAPRPRKSAADVSVYISILERALSEKLLEDDPESVQDFRADTIPAARELSEEWIAHEEVWAERLMAGQTAAEKWDIEKARKKSTKSIDLNQHTDGITNDTVSDNHDGDLSLSSSTKPVYKINSKTLRSLKRSRALLESQGQDLDASLHSSDEDLPSSPEPSVALQDKTTVARRKRRKLEDEWIKEDFLREIDSARAALLDEAIARAEDPTRAERIDQKIFQAVSKRPSPASSSFLSSPRRKRGEGKRRSPAENNALRLGSFLLTAQRAGVTFEQMKHDGVDLFRWRQVHRMTSSLSRSLASAKRPSPHQLSSSQTLRSNRVPYPFTHPPAPGTSFLNARDRRSRTRLEPLIHRDVMRLLVAYLKVWVTQIIELLV